MPGDEIVSVLAKCFDRHDENGYVPGTEEEIRLWKEGFAHDPLAIAKEIGHSLKNPEHARKFDFLRPQVEEFWEKQLTRMNAAEEDFQIEGNQSHWTAGLALLKNLELKFDVELWKKLANFPGFTISKFRNDEGGKVFELVVYEYPVCNKAAEYLIVEGHNVERIRERQVLFSKVPVKEK